jgi:hypothetical protein
LIAEDIWKERAEAQERMAKAWSDYCQAKRDFDRLDQEAQAEFDRFMHDQQWAHCTRPSITAG